MFTDYYSQNSCTAGRAAFLTGQSPLRTGLLKVGLPGARQGLQDKDPTIAEMLKMQGYATAQIGKNHLGDRNEYLPTRHGFDQFYGNLYHLNSEEEPEDPDYPKDPKFHAQFGPRGVLDCRATDRDDPTEIPRFGAWGKQSCKDTGPLNSKRMETLENDLLAHSVEFMQRAVKANQPFFPWHASSRMHVWTHLQEKWKNQTGFGLYADGMAELDNVVGEILKTLDTLGIADNTIVVFSSDNGAELFTWPDGGMHPFRGEKGTTWEGGFRVPTVVRWPGVIKPGTIYNDIMSHAAAGRGGPGAPGGRGAGRGGAAANPIVLSRNGRNFTVTGATSVRAGTEIKAQTEASSVNISLSELESGSWVIFELPGFTTAATGTAQDSLDALRSATSTSYYKGEGALWVKVVATAAPAAPGGGGGRGGRGGLGGANTIQVNR